MKLIRIACLFLMTSAMTLLAFAQETPGFQEADVQKTSQTNFKFLSLSVDPRASAMGGAATAQDMAYSNAMFYNPATMAYMESAVSLGVMQTQWIADINYNAASVAFRPGNGNYGVIGLSFVSVDYGDFIGTVHDANPSGYLDTGNFSPSALAVGVGYARALTDRFAIGGNVKYAYQDLKTSNVDFAEDFATSGNYISRAYTKGTMVFDFGALYQTGFRSMNFAVSVRNFARELKYEQENFELPLTFRIGLSMDMLDFANVDRDMHSFRVAVDANRPRDFAEQIMVGGEYLFMQTVALRAGYTFPTDLEGLNLGVGVQRDLGTFGFSFNYTYTSFDVFDAVNRLGVQLSF
jgi:hypothetical protein